MGSVDNRHQQIIESEFLGHLLDWIQEEGLEEDFEEWAKKKGIDVTESTTTWDDYRFECAEKEITSNE